EWLRGIILGTLPELNEKLSYQVPYYSRFHPICFIWPGSVLWGKKRSYEGVRFGFTKGSLLSNPDVFLQLQHRKQVAYHDFTRIDGEAVIPIQRMLYEAYLIDEQSKKKKNT